MVPMKRKRREIFVINKHSLFSSMLKDNDAAGQSKLKQCRVRYSTVQYSTVQYSTVQYSTVQYSRYDVVPHLRMMIA